MKRQPNELVWTLVVLTKLLAGLATDASVRKWKMAASMLVALSATSVIHAAQITSSAFTLGYGWLKPGDVQLWTGTENAGTNSPATLGQFTFNAPAPSGGQGMSTTGCTFGNMTLTDGAANYAGFFGVDGGTTYGLSLVIDGSYNGVAPANVDTSNPGYKLTLVIDEISVYGISNGGHTTAWKWTETTAGHTGESTAVDVLASAGAGGFNVAGDYKKIEWNPSDDTVSLNLLGDTVTRTFALSPAADAYGAVDGLVIKGYVVLTYNAIPEPSALMLLAPGLIGLLASWRKRK